LKFKVESGAESSLLEDFKTRLVEGGSHQISGGYKKDQFTFRVD